MTQIEKMPHQHAGRMTFEEGERQGEQMPKGPRAEPRITGRAEMREPRAEPRERVWVTTDPKSGTAEFKAAAKACKAWVLGNPLWSKAVCA